MRPFDDIDRLERAESLDQLAAAISGVVRRLLRNRDVKDALHGVWLGHPLHPALAQFALGSYLSATVLDWAGGRRRESDILIGLGLLSTAPTVAAGWADWVEGHPGQQRVGLVHAMTNVAAVGCYASALMKRVRPRGGRGRLLTLAGATLAGAGATLGGHLGYRQAFGANRGEDAQLLGPGEWRPIGPVTDLPDGEAVKRLVGDVPVFVLRRGDTVVVRSDRCPHMAGPLHQGELSDTDGDLCVTCPWHGSVFRLEDGAVVHGPATAALPRFDTRTTDGKLEVRVVAVPGLPVTSS